MIKLIKTTIYCYVLCKDRNIKIPVEIALTDADQIRGLKFRKYLHPQYRMLFPGQIDQWIIMTMKDVNIPLDMVFINTGHRVVDIIEEIPANYPYQIITKHKACHVLELNGEFCHSYRIQTGDYVQFKFIDGYE